MISIVLVLAVVALYRLWDSPHTTLWWSLLAALVLTLWVGATVRTAVADTGVDARVEPNPARAALGSPGGEVVRFWAAASMMVAAVTLILAVVAIVVA